ncbi:hypothetical protein LNV23_10805 [Paucibacter sp. DJ1R-11]|uniref:hypothetical protein n=1 Tax=Paucibacter sp. DJ1R-11 TaxID=2893556 RepID=UPI0021E3DF95|nr:hypothetical protein [Paucibacter sp. DJ1R-11]MCV2363937.1 hypothetical protein [Paucibacter sp. DJ1R-11]
MKQLENRKTLKKLFSDGALPTEHDFAALIDSMLNMSDEGFRKTPANGEEIYAPVGHHALLSFYRDQFPETALWRVALSPATDRLQFSSGDQAKPLLGLTAPESPKPGLRQPKDGEVDLDNRRGRVGIACGDPRDTLEVAGVIASTGRRGRHATATRIAADGQWHEVIGGLQGCQGFEVVAGAGGSQGKGHFGLLHAIALSAFNPSFGLLAWWRRRRGIRQTQAWWGRRCDRLELRWHGGSGRGGSYSLQIRTGCDFGPDQVIQVQLTQLWFDQEMAQCKQPKDSSDAEADTAQDKP